MLQYEEAKIFQNQQMKETRPVVDEKAAAFLEESDMVEMWPLRELVDKGS